MHPQRRPPRAPRALTAGTALLIILVLPLPLHAQETKPAPSKPPAPIAEFIDSSDENPEYQWTTDHMHVGVRWQPFAGRPENNAYDASRPIMTKYSSYAQFWVAWSASEPAKKNTDYDAHMSSYLKTIEQAVDHCVAEGLKVEFVFWHCPAWASESGEGGPRKPKIDHFNAFAARIAHHFKGRVHAYQLAHEANLESLMVDGDIDFLVSEIFTKGARAIREVYGEAPAEPVIISTSGCSPCLGCPSLAGLNALGGEAINNFYNRLIADAEMMDEIDALNLNVSDQNDGYGNIDGGYVASVWDNYDLAREKLDAYGYRGKSILASESWITWDNTHNSGDVNGDGTRNELDAYHKALTIMGRCLQRGLNTMNFPWSDNSSGWSMGLTKRRDYNGRLKELRPDLVIPAKDGGADIVTAKVSLDGTDSSFTVRDGELEFPFTIDDYIDPPDPNHLHYYIWRWFAQIAGGHDEVIRHAVAGEAGNDIAVYGPDFTGPERYRISSYNRTRDRFLVLIYASGATASTWAKLVLPAKIQDGWHYNNEFSRRDFRGEGFEEGEQFYARIITKDISPQDGSDINTRYKETDVLTVTDGLMTVPLIKMNKFTAVELVRADAQTE